MNPSDIIFGAYIGVGGAAIGALITGILAYHSGKTLIQKTHENDLRIIRITEFNKAASLFLEAFVMEIFLLRENINTGDHMPDNIINRDALVAHEKAKILFEPFVPLTELERFNQAWEKYKKADAEYSQGDRSISAFKTQRSRDHLGHINGLLSFAKPRI